MEKLFDFIAKRRRNFAYLFEGLKQFESSLLLPTWHSKANPSWFAFPITVRDDAPFDRHEITRFLEEQRIETRPLFAGNILKQPGYGDICSRVGVFPGLDVPQLDYMIATFEKFHGRL